MLFAVNVAVLKALTAHAGFHAPVCFAPGRVWTPSAGFTRADALPSPDDQPIAVQAEALAKALRPVRSGAVTVEALQAGVAFRWGSGSAMLPHWGSPGDIPAFPAAPPYTCRIHLGCPTDWAPDGPIARALDFAGDDVGRPSTFAVYLTPDGKAVGTDGRRLRSETTRGTYAKGRGDDVPMGVTFTREALAMAKALPPSGVVLSLPDGATVLDASTPDGVWRVRASVGDGGLNSDTFRSVCGFSTVAAVPVDAAALAEALRTVRPVRGKANGAGDVVLTLWLDGSAAVWREEPAAAVRLAGTAHVATKDGGDAVHLDATLLPALPKRGTVTFRINPGTVNGRGECIPEPCRLDGAPGDGFVVMMPRRDELSPGSAALACAMLATAGESAAPAVAPTAPAPASTPPAADPEPVAAAPVDPEPASTPEPAIGDAPAARFPVGSRVALTRDVPGRSGTIDSGTVGTVADGYGGPAAVLVTFAAPCRAGNAWIDVDALALLSPEPDPEPASTPAPVAPERTPAPVWHKGDRVRTLCEIPRFSVPWDRLRPGMVGTVDAEPTADGAIRVAFGNDSKGFAIIGYAAPEGLEAAPAPEPTVPAVLAVGAIVRTLRALRADTRIRGGRRAGIAPGTMARVDALSDRGVRIVTLASGLVAWCQPAHVTTGSGDPTAAYVAAGLGEEYAPPALAAAPTRADGPVRAGLAYVLTRDVTDAKTGDRSGSVPAGTTVRVVRAARSIPDRWHVSGPDCGGFTAWVDGSDLAPCPATPDPEPASTPEPVAPEPVVDCGACGAVAVPLDHVLTCSGPAADPEPASTPEPASVAAPPVCQPCQAHTEPPAAPAPAASCQAPAPASTPEPCTVAPAKARPVLRVDVDTLPTVPAIVDGPAKAPAGSLSEHATAVRKLMHVATMPGRITALRGASARVERHGGTLTIALSVPAGRDVECARRAAIGVADIAAPGVTVAVTVATV